MAAAAFVQSERRIVASFGVVIATLVAAAVLFAAVEGQALAAALLSALLAAAVWGGLRAARSTRRRVVEPETAVALRGPFEREVRAADSGAARTTIGDERAFVPAWWEPYLAPGREVTVWTIRTTSLPIVVAIERGPSIDADVALGGGVSNAARHPGRFIGAPVAALVLFATLMLETVAPDFMPIPLKGLILTVGLLGVGALAWGAWRTHRAHVAYYHGGARFAPSPAQWWRARVVGALRLALPVAVVSYGIAWSYAAAWAETTTTESGNPLMVSLLSGAFAALWDGSVPPANEGNPGSGVLRPCVPPPPAVDPE